MKDHAARQPKKTNEILSVYEFDVCNTLSNCLLLNVQQFSGFGPQNTISPVFWQLHDFPNIWALTFPNPLIIPTVNLTNGETLPYLIKGKSPHSCNIEKKTWQKYWKILKKAKLGQTSANISCHIFQELHKSTKIMPPCRSFAAKWYFCPKPKQWSSASQRLRAGEWKLETKREKWG